MADFAPTHRPFIVPVFLPHAGCPHQCVFCNQRSITGVKQHIVSSKNVHCRINEFLRYKKRDRRKVQIAFYGGNFLGLKKDDIKFFLNESAAFVKNKDVDSIRFSTRPDTIDPGRLEMIKNYPVSEIEIGVQSMDDRVLTLIKRGHSASDVESAVKLLKSRDYKIGLQMMVGLPGEDEVSSLYTANRIGVLEPDFVRIYPTVVLKNSPLAGWYEKGTFRPWSLERSIAHVKNLYIFFKKKRISVIRMGLQSGKYLDGGTAVLAGPYHPAFGHMVHSEIFLDMATGILETEGVFRDKIVLKVHPRNISKMRGLKNRNVKTLKRRFHIKTLRIIPDSSLPQDRLVVSSKETEILDVLQHRQT